MGPERFGDAIFWLDCPSVQKSNARNTKSNGEISRLCQNAACLNKRTLRQIGPMDLWRIWWDAPYQDTRQGVAIFDECAVNRSRRAPLQRGETQPSAALASVERIVYVVTANRTLPAGQSMFCPMRQSTPVGSTITKSRIPHGPVPHCPGMKDCRATTLLPIGCSKCRSFMQSYPWGSRNQRAFFLAHRLLGCMQSWQLGFRFPNGSVWSESCRRRSNLRCTAG